MKLLGIAGSLRKDSFNKKLLAALAKFLPPQVEFSTFDIGTLPLFNQDDEKERYPAAAQALKNAILEADGVIIASPEYNRSIPGPLKNALDWADRPSGESAWLGKSVLITGASNGMIGTAVAHYDIVKVLLHAEARVAPIEVAIGTFKERFDEEGNVTDPKTEEVLRAAIAKFLEFI